MTCIDYFVNEPRVKYSHMYLCVSMYNFRLGYYCIHTYIHTCMPYLYWLLMLMLMLMLLMLYKLVHHALVIIIIIIIIVIVIIILNLST